MQPLRSFSTGANHDAEIVNGNGNSEQGGGTLMQQFRLVPVSEHPLFPGSSQALQLNKDQYEILKDTE